MVMISRRRKNKWTTNTRLSKSLNITKLSYFLFLQNSVNLFAAWNYRTYQCLHLAIFGANSFVIVLSLPWKWTCGECYNQLCLTKIMIIFLCWFQCNPVFLWIGDVWGLGGVVSTCLEYAHILFISLTPIASSDQFWTQLFIIMK